ncbi:hypothetical protein [Lactobacillus helveticus]|uniref:Uncharacterized protein n=1 Tax=Lactobacillus helveticus TaxID=1587 RepID=A0A6A7JZK5_LACHE|nr:hypothetical protein [Lactobacillus helveticus]MPW13737.1 hypothetical protein [Lactobacillus helveticus]
MSDIKDFCTFCDPDAEDKKRIYYKTKNFTVWLSVGQIVEGYSLIIPNDHYNCIGVLPGELQEEYLCLKSLIRKKITEIYGKCVFYEHGRAGYCHVQPVNANLKKKLVKDGLFPIKLQKPTDIFSKYYELGQYLYYGDTEGQGYLFQINRPIPRQYLRTSTAQAIGKPELADWHKYPELDKLWTGKKKLLRALQGEENN